MSQSGVLNSKMPAPGTLLFVEGDTGGQVGPDGTGTIFLIGGNNVSVDGNPGTNTLTIDISGTSFSAITTDATPTIAGSLPLPTNSTITVQISFAAVADDFQSGVGGTSLVVVGTLGAGAVLLGGSHNNIIDDTGGTPDITYQVLGLNLQIFVTGEATTTLTWNLFARTTVAP